MHEIDFRRFVSRLVVADDHMLWTGGFGPGGYGLFRFDGRSVPAHRVAYELWVAPIPRGYQIDHLCFVRCCVSPLHLEAVTPEENRWRIRRFEADRYRAPEGETAADQSLNDGDTSVILSYLTSEPGATKNRIVTHAVQTITGCGITRAKTAIQRAVDSGLVTARRVGTGRTDPVLHTLTTAGKAWGDQVPE